MLSKESFQEVVIIPNYLLQQEQDICEVVHALERIKDKSILVIIHLCLDRIFRT